MPINNIKSMPEVMYMKINNVNNKKLGDLKNLKQVKKRESIINQDNGEKKEIKPNNAGEIRFHSQKLIQKAINKTAKMPEIREEKVAKIKAKVKEGTYNVSNREIARAMIGNLLNEIA